MIVRNEEAIVEQAVRSAAGLADEVVALDTDSTDGTVALLRSLGVTVIEGGDRMHKGESRNAAADASTGDWTVVLDADEQIADPTGVRTFLEGTDAQAVYIRLAYVESNGKQSLSYQQMRCWQRGTFRYQYRAHEVPVPVNGWGKLAHTEFIWEHRPPAGRGWKSDYTLERLKLDVLENPGDARPLYYLGRQHVYRGEWPEAERNLLAYLGSKGHWDRADAWELLSRCPGRDKVADLHQAAACDPKRRDWWCALAEHYHTHNQNEVAVGMLKLALELPRPTDGYCNEYWHGAITNDLLARCYWRLGRYQEGYEQASIALRMEPESRRLAENLAWFAGKVGQGPDYYDLVYAQIVADADRMARIGAVADAVAPHVLGSVLDMGCGLGLLADRVQGEYTGLDFSDFAVKWAREYTANGNARFFKMDLRDGRDLTERFDTVVLTEVLEHLADPQAMIAKARARAERRLVVTVPVNMPDPAHVKPAWSVEDLAAMFPAGRVAAITGGDRWLVVEDV